MLHCLGLGCCIFFGSVASFPSAPLLHVLGSVAAFHWVRMLHCTGFGGYIAVGSDGPLKELGSVGLRRIDHPGRYMYRGVERSWFWIVVNIVSYHRNRNPILSSQYHPRYPSFPPSFLCRSLHRAWHRPFSSYIGEQSASKSVNAVTPARGCIYLRRRRSPSTYSVSDITSPIQSIDHRAFTIYLSI